MAIGLTPGMKVLVYDNDPKENYAAKAFGIQGKIVTIVAVTSFNVDVEFIHDTLGLVKNGVPLRCIFIPVIIIEENS